MKPSSTQLFRLPLAVSLACLAILACAHVGEDRQVEVKVTTSDEEAELCKI